VAALREGGFLMLYPGANREAALRSYRDDPYHLDWSGRKGFLRVALEADADLLFVAAVGIDEAYYQSRLPTPQALVRYATGGDGERYRGARLAFGLLGPHLVPGVCPLPVRITHVVSEPISLGSASERAAAKSDARTLGRLHRKVWRRCQALLDEAVGGREPESDWLDRTVRRTQSLLQRIGV